MPAPRTWRERYQNKSKIKNIGRRKGRKLSSQYENPLSRDDAPRQVGDGNIRHLLRNIRHQEIQSGNYHKNEYCAGDVAAETGLFFALATVFVWSFFIQKIKIHLLILA